MFNFYKGANYVISDLYFDREFEPLRDALKADDITKGARLNTTGKGEHVPEIERRIQVIKERTRAERMTLPYTHLPIIMIVDLLGYLVTWLNAFPTSSGIPNYVPRTLLTGTKLTNDKHCRCPFGTYVQTHEETSNNTASERTLDAICLGPTGNVQGTCAHFAHNPGPQDKNT